MVGAMSVVIAGVSSPGRKSTGRRKFACIVRFALIAMPIGVTLGGCNTDPLAPPPGEAGRKAAVEAGGVGAATIDELREKYEAAHRNKDFKSFAHLCGWNVGWTSQLPRIKEMPTETAMRQIMRFPIQTVEFEPDPPPDHDGRAAAYGPAKGEPTDEITGDIRGKLILVMANGERIDPSYVVLNYYGRFFVNVAQLVVQDAAEHLETGRPLKYHALPTESFGLKK
jgi:hypothetical protein